MFQRSFPRRSCEKLTVFLEKYEPQGEAWKPLVQSLSLIRLQILYKKGMKFSGASS